MIGLKRRQNGERGRRARRCGLSWTDRSGRSIRRETLGIILGFIRREGNDALK